MQRRVYSKIFRENCVRLSLERDDISKLARELDIKADLIERI